MTQLALFSSVIEGQKQDLGSMPGYMLAADMHNTGNDGDGFSWFSPTSWYNAVTQLPSFTAVSILSGANSFYNTGVAVANFFGADKEFNDTGVWISSLDSNLGEYYSDNRQAADLVGFIGSSFVPGLLGMKALSAGQKALTAAKDTGIIGTNLGKAVGLLTPSPQYWTAQSVRQIATAQTTFSTINSNTLRAVASGFGEAALQSAAFEVAVAATMFKSPILDDMDLGDITKNIAFGAVLGAGIGGVFSAAKTYGVIKRSVSAVDEIEKAYTFTPQLAENLAPADKIVLWLDHLKQVPSAEDGAKLAAAKIGQESAVSDFTKRFSQQVKARDTSVWNAIRTEVSKMAGNDQVLTETLFNAIRGMDSDLVMRNLFGAAEIGRADAALKIVKEIKKAETASFGTLEEISTGLDKLLNKAVLTDVDVPAGFTNMEFVKAAFQNLNAKSLINKLNKFAKNYKGDNEETIKRMATRASGFLAKKEFFEAKEVLDELSVLRMSSFEKNTKEILWVKAWGDDAGKVVPEQPRTLGISDSQKDVKSFIASQKFVVGGSEGIDEVLKNPLRAQARYIWAQGLKEVTGNVKALDFPLLERAYELGNKVNVVTVDGTVTLQGEKLLSYIAQAKEEMSVALLEERLKVKNLLPKAKTKSETRELEQRLRDATNSDDVAKLLNVRRAYLEGEISDDIIKDIFAYQSYQRAYQQDLITRGLWTEARGQYELYNLPQWIQIGYKKDIIQDADGNLLRGIALIKGKQKLHDAAVDNVLAAPRQMGSFFSQFFRIPEQAVLESNRFGAGSGLFSFANGNYGSLAAIMESIGASTNALKNNLRDVARAIIEPSLIKMRGDTEAALELQAVFQKLAATSENYVLTESGVLRPQRLVQYENAIAAGNTRAVKPTLQEDILLRIQISNDTTLEVLKNHVSRNGERILGRKERAALQGMESSLSADVVYVPKPNPQDYPYFFFVVDEAVTSEASGRVRMVHAATAKDLESLRNKIPSQYKVVTKGQTEEYYKALGQYDFERTLHNSNLDVNLKRVGVNSQFLPKTDPKLITDDLLNWHLRQEDIQAREMVALRYEKEFLELEKLGEQYTGIALSKYGYDRKFADSVVKNPYVNYVKTALDISKIEEYPMLANINRTVDRAFSEAARTIGGIFGRTQTVEDLETVNSAMERYGLKTVFSDVDTLLAANHTAPRGALTKFVRNANALLASTLLRLDPLNAINNSVGAQVMLGAETRSLLRSIAAADKTKAGKLAELLSVNVPGSEVQLKSAGRLIANAHADYIRSVSNPEVLDEFRRLGYVTDLTNQYHRMLDDLTLRGNESVTDLEARTQRVFAAAKKIGDKGEKWTGNSHAEEMNRFVAAHVMKQITDVAVEAGVLLPDEAVGYIRTFVNRTQGNILASQRPLMFQGPIGQSIGLFQTYQFNLIQQLLRYVSEGTAKDAAVLMGLQGTIYGLNGLPGFSFINQHLVGTASGNKEHTDLYAATYGLFGNSVADVLMYGFPSNMLGTNLYTRGDINPRHPTIIPVSPYDVPIVSVAGKFFSSIAETLGKVNNGGAIWESFLQGIEHSGLSRPAAGLAQVLRGFEDGTAFSTSTRGNILGVNDLFSWGSAVRLLGGKPFDEARLVDAMHRFLYYNSYDRSKRISLGESLKTITVDGEMPNPEQIEKFAERYAARGGDIRNFNRWMMEQVKNSQTSQVNAIAENLKKPYAQQMQLLMGGEVYMDGRNQ